VQNNRVIENMKASSSQSMLISPRHPLTIVLISIKTSFREDYHTKRTNSNVVSWIAVVEYNRAIPLLINGKIIL
jgi:hypothetical protein